MLIVKCSYCNRAYDCDALLNPGLDTTDAATNGRLCPHCKIWNAGQIVVDWTGQAKFENFIISRK